MPSARPIFPFVVAILGASAYAGEVVRVPLRVEPPQTVRAITIEAGGAVHSCPVREGVVLVPASLPLPWTVAMLRFDATSYRENDLARGAPLLLRRHGELRVRLDPPPKPGEVVKALLVRASESKPLELDLIAGDDGTLETALSAGTYAGAFLGRWRATRIRSGIVINPGDATEAGTLAFDPAASVSFRVLDATTGRPVAGATATWTPPQALNDAVARVLFSGVWSGTSGRDGRVVFPAIGPVPLSGQWTLEGRAYAPATARLTLTEPRTATLDDVLLRPAQVLLVDVIVPRDARALENAWLVLSRPEGEASARYEAVSRQRLRAGINEVAIGAPGRIRLSIVTAANRTVFFENLDIGPADRRVVLAPMPTEIRGTVRRDGRPLESVLVTAAERTDARTVLAQTRTAADGEYSLVVFQKGPILLYTNGPVEQGRAARPVLKSITLSGESALRADFTLPTASASIVVVDAVSRRPVAATLQGRLTTTRGESRGVFAETDDDGRASFAGVDPGRATVFIRASGYRGREVTIEIGEEPAEVTVELDEGGGLSGRVTDNHGVPVASARVLGGFPSPIAMQGHVQTATDASGAFEIVNATAPGVPVFVVAPNHALGIAFLRESEPAQIRLSPPNAGGVRLVAGAAPRATLSMFLAAPRGGGIIPYGVLHELGAAHGMSPFQLLGSGSDGTLLLPQLLPPGEYTLVEVTPPKGGEPETYRAVADLRVPLAPGSVVTLRE